MKFLKKTHFLFLNYGLIFLFKPLITCFITLSYLLTANRTKKKAIAIILFYYFYIWKSYFQKKDLSSIFKKAFSILLFWFKENPHVFYKYFISYLFKSKNDFYNSLFWIAHKFCLFFRLDTYYLFLAGSIKLSPYVHKFLNFFWYFPLFFDLISYFSLKIFSLSGHSIKLNVGFIWIGSSLIPYSSCYT